MYLSSILGRQRGADRSPFGSSRLGFGRLAGHAAIALIIGGTAAACGGNGYNANSMAFNDVFGAIPGDANYAIAVDLSTDDAERLMADGESATATGSGIFSEIAGMIGDDFLGADGMDSLGLDLSGEYAIFSRHLSPILLLRVTDSDAFADSLAAVESRNPDLEWQDNELAGTTFRQAELPGGLQVYVGQRGDYAVVRVGINDDDDIAEAELAEVFYGTHEAGDVWQHPAAAALQSEMEDGADLVELMFIESATMNDLRVATAEAITSPSLQLSEEGLDYDVNIFGSSEQEAACLVAADQVVAAYPWIGYAIGRDDQTSYSRALVQVGDSLSDQVDAWLGGAIDLDAAGAPALGVSLHADLMGIFESFQADPGLARCPNLGAAAGLAATLVATFGQTIAPILSLTDGDIAIAINNLEMRGFIPFIDAGFMFSTSNADALAATLGDLLVAQGASANVDTTGPVPAVDYRILIIRARIEQWPDRVVMTIGNTDPNTVANLQTGEVGGDNAPFLNVTWDGERMRSILDTVMGYLAPGAFEDSEMAAFTTQMENLMAIETLRIGGDWVDGRLILRFDNTSSAE